MSTALVTAAGQLLTPEVEAALAAEAQAGLDVERLVARRPKMSALEVADRAAQWRAAPMGSPGAQVDLHEYLGMTWEQYRRWAATGEIPTF